jgi:gamma-glutamyltranspeptidase/glutathione hydrolase
MRRLLWLLCLQGSFALAADNSHIPEAASALNQTQSVSAQHFMAVTANSHATTAAFDMLKRGGSAIDAAIAAQLVLGLTEPQSSGIGGGAFMLYWDSAKTKLHYFDGRETAPAAVDENYFLQDDGKPLAFMDAVIGGHSVGVPGVIKLFALAHSRYGKLQWATLFEPAIALAQNGFAISPRLYTLLKETPRLQESAALREYFFLADGNPKPIGFVLKNPAYANTLKQLARGGENAFYRGAIARDIVAAVNGSPNSTGNIALGDLAAYRAIEREPVCAAYFSYRICGAAPPSSGGTTVLAILGMLQQFSADQRKPGSVDFYHLFAEASALAFADRDTYVADPDFIAVPTQELVAPDYLAARAALIDPKQATPAASAGAPRWPQAAHIDYLASASPELLSTSHVSIVDSFGNALSMTTSVESAFGSRVLVDGFVLNNQLTDFSFTPRDQDGKRVANRIEAGKRPRSSMAPTIVFKDAKPLLLIGSPGSARIIDYVAQTLVYVLDGKLGLDEAIASPHIVSLNRGVELESGKVGEAEKTALTAFGHTIKEVPQSSGLNGILIEQKGLTGVSDPRREGVAKGL